MSGCIPGNGVRRQNGIGNKFHCVSPVRRIVLLQPDLYVPREPGDFRSGYLTRRVLLLFFFFCYRQHTQSDSAIVHALSELARAYV